MRSKTTLRTGLFTALVLAFVLTACSRFQSASNSTPADLPTAIATFSPTVTATPIIIPTATATATPEPPQPHLSVPDQILVEDGQVVIDQVMVLEPGWIVIHTDVAGEVGEVLGYVEVSENDSEDLSVTIDPLQASPILHAVLHIDAGEAGTFEFPGPDRPVVVESDFVKDSFEVDVQVYVPTVTVSEQELSDDGLIIIDSVAAAGPGWIAIHAEENGEPGQLLGYAPVKKGENEDIAVRLNWTEAAPTLYAVLYEDAGEAGRFDDQDLEQPVAFDGEPVRTMFGAILPPDVFVLDQPVLDGAIMVERAVSYGQGWLVVYYDEEGELGKIIGWSPLEDGVNQQIVITVTESAVTPILHLMLHEDLEEVGEFGFPRTDPLAKYQDRIPNPFSIRTDTGNFLITRDQELSSTNTVTIPMVVVDVDAWAVVRAGEVDGPGEIAGMTWLPARFHRDVIVEVDPELVTDTMYVILHLDGGFSQEFEFPDGFDILLQRNRSPIQAPFAILQESDDQ